MLINQIRELMLEFKQLIEDFTFLAQEKQIVCTCIQKEI